MRPPKINPYILFLRGHSTTLGVGYEFLYFRNKAVLGLPVSTTSYSRHAVSTVQSPISTANNGSVLNQHRQTKHFPPGLHFHFPFILGFSSSYCWNIKTSYILRVTGNYSTSTESYLAWQGYRPTHASITLLELRNCATKVSFNSYKLNAHILN